jgi:diaminopimelate epimerase
VGLRFTKMHGAGNDFVILDLRGGRAAPDVSTVRAIGERHTGVGFDQLLSLETSDLPGCVARYRIWNSDGSLAEQCGNGARCVAAWLVRDGAATAPRFTLESPAGLIAVDCLPDGRFELDMGRPEFDPARIPFLGATQAQDSYQWRIDGQPLAFGAASMGNPHALIVVDDIGRAPVAALGPKLQADPAFPQGVNVGFAQVLAPDEIRLRVYERGAGETLACGSGACAAVAVLVRQGRVGRRVQVHLPGGTLVVDWPADDAPLRMAGPATFVFEGEWLA